MLIVLLLSLAVSLASRSVGFRGLRLQGGQRYLRKRKEPALRQGGQEESHRQTCLRYDELEWKSERGRYMDSEGDWRCSPAIERLS